MDRRRRLRLAEYALHVVTCFADAEASSQREVGLRSGESGGREGGNANPDAGLELPEGAQRLGIDSVL